MMPVHSMVASLSTLACWQLIDVWRCNWMLSSNPSQIDFSQSMYQCIVKIIHFSISSNKNSCSPLHYRHFLKPASLGSGVCPAVWLSLVVVALWNWWIHLATLLIVKTQELCPVMKNLTLTSLTPHLSMIPRGPTDKPQPNLHDHLHQPV